MTSTLSRVGNSAYDASVAALTNVSFQPLVALSRFSVTALLTRLQVGQLEITDTDGSTRVYGDPTLRAKAVVHAQEAGGIVQGATRALSTDASDNALTSPQPRTPDSEQESDSQSDGASSSQSTLAVPSPASPQSHSKASSAPNASGPPRAALKVISDTFWIRMFIGADMGFAEAFMAGDVETPDLGACFSVFIHNRDALSNLNTGIFASLSSRIQSLLNRQYANTKSGSLKNIGAHYDISNTMYDAFLSRDMTYSCGVFPTLDADLIPSLPAPGGSAFNQTATAAVAKLASIAQGATANGSVSAGLSSNEFSTDDLEDSQIRKLRMHISRADIRPGHRVLEIGTGWGSFAMEAARLTGCTVDSLTLSVEQKALAEARIARAGLSDRIRVHLLDYRDMPASWSDSFDRVVSIEMLEAVGIEFLETYFAAVSRVLKRRGGVGVFQCITIPEDRFEVYKDEVDFIKKYIFPGGCLPSVTRLFEAARVGSKGTLIPEGLTSIGPHYARTLREWRRKFEAHFETQIRPALIRDHSEIRRLSAEGQEKEVEVFRKKWIYYFVYCEVGFAERVIGDHILTFVREGNTSYPSVCA
ncbi:hypothetical protein OC846_002943 [Tilletia horrida]|uniref:Cyclopropane-fatty-acyl-phospholipid synthase n=1 Tax=Tilletia horrida TaxID=155126 RepID=A0AAN6GR38_9BASI|nr:hypothetical protein OC846_002943 [Tilletia horrida]KAK0566874.1 hypothetical protein OC861_002996 [Tilletia horrida]